MNLFNSRKETWLAILTSLVLGSSWVDIVAGQEVFADLMGSQFSGELVETWNTGSILNGFRIIASGDTDGDGRAEFVGNHFAYCSTTLHLFESMGQGQFAEIWDSSDEPDVCGTYLAAAFGDTDNDGDDEIVVSVAYSSNILIYERDLESGDLHQVVEYSDHDAGNWQALVGNPVIGDADGDGDHEIILIRYGRPISPSWMSSISILSRHGDSIVRDFNYRTNRNITHASVVDLDGDGYPSIVLENRYDSELLRLEFDPDQGTWVEKTFALNIEGKVFNPFALDLGPGGRPGLIFHTGHSVAIASGAGNDEFRIRALSDPSPVFLVDLAVAPWSPLQPNPMTVAAVGYEGELVMWEVDPMRGGFKVTQDIQIPNAYGGRLALMADRGDHRPILALATAGRTRVFRESPQWENREGKAASNPGRLVVAPNPFNPRTSVQFTTDCISPVRIGVYDARGHRVASIADGLFPAGHHAVEWDGKTSTGSPASSGQYFFRVNIAGVERTEKAMLLQ